MPSAYANRESHQLEVCTDEVYDTELAGMVERIVVSLEPLTRPEAIPLNGFQDFGRIVISDLSFEKASSTGEFAVSSIIQSGPIASRPAASAATAPKLWFATDTFRLSFNDGSSWTDSASGTIPSGGLTITAGDLAVTAGDATLGAGDLTLDAGNAKLTAGQLWTDFIQDNGGNSFLNLATVGEVRTASGVDFVAINSQVKTDEITNEAGALKMTLSNSGNVTLATGEDLVIPATGELHVDQIDDEAGVAKFDLTSEVVTPEFLQAIGPDVVSPILANGLGDAFIEADLECGDQFIVGKAMLFSRVFTTAQFTANQDDLVVNGFSMVRASSDASRNVTGILAPGTDQRTLRIIMNVGSFNIVLTNEDANSAAANRIITGTGASVTLTPDDTATLWYDHDTDRWRITAVHGS